MEVETIKKNYERAKEIFDKEAHEAFDAPTVEDYMAQHAAAYRRFEPYKIAYNSVREPLMSPIPKYGSHYTLEEFVAMCECGGFIDYDGHGNYATATERTNIGIVPSDVTDNVYIKDKYTHVCWFNK